LQAHGSPVLLRAMMERVMVLGCRPAQPGEFTRRAVENGKMNLSQAEAVAACIEASTLRAARQAQRHLQGEFGQKVNDIMQALTGIIAHVEACLDFPEEEVPEFFFEQIREQLNERVLAPVRDMLKHAYFGERLFDGAMIAIVGAPNVGKSSLLNALAGRDRAIVSDIAGTTRDVLEVHFEVNGIPLCLQDTAGLRESDDALEREGVNRTRKVIEQADVVVFVADATRHETWDSGQHAHINLMNKTDLADPGMIPPHFLAVSAVKGGGLDVFIQRLVELLEALPREQEGILVTCRRHEHCLRQAGACLEQGLQLASRPDRLELVSLEWRRAWSALGEILGVGDVEHILDRIFAEFCIGK
jgi:tRNA modification GTPase